jgi:enolase
MSKIKSIHAREILDSRGNPTIEVTIKTEKSLAKAGVPSGASTGGYEAFELRDHEKRFRGLGVKKAVSNVNNEIAKKIVGIDCKNQALIDRKMIELDATENKSRLGANAILAVSMAVCRAGSMDSDIELYGYIGKMFKKRPKIPVPNVNVIGGGKHAGNDLDFQEYHIIPVRAKTFSQAIRMCAEVYHELKNILKRKYGKCATNISDEGAFAPPMRRVNEPFDAMLKAIEQCGYEKRIKLGFDAAASVFFRKGYYIVEGKKLTKEKLTDTYLDMVENYPIVSMEDVFDEDDWEAWVGLTNSLRNVKVIGDDLLSTNLKRIKTAVERKACNTLLLKINQIGTITESLEAARLVLENGWDVMVSHRSGETNDSFISDLVVGLGAGHCKFGAPARGERVAKYNRLLGIEESGKIGYGKF